MGPPAEGSPAPVGRPFDAVTFDYWNTLVYETRGQLRGLRIEAWAGLLEEAGYTTERSLLDAVFESSWQRYVSHWTAGQQYQAAHAAEDLIEQLGFSVPTGVRGQLVEAFTDVGEQAELHLAEGAAEVVTALKGAGLAVGVICDVGMTPSRILRSHLERHGLLASFDHLSFSDEIGHYKPSAIMFNDALTGLGVRDPGRAVHVGDIRRTDVAGALAMGMTAVRYLGIEDDDSQTHPEADHVIRHHRELLPIVGITGGTES